MRAKIIFMVVLLSVISSYAQSQNDMIQKSTKWRAFSEIDIPIAIFTGGLAANLGACYENYRISAGYSRFDAPSKTYSGVPDGFKLRVDYIFALNLDYFFSKSKTDKGFYTRLMYHNKRQYVENKSTKDSKFLYSQLVGLEIGYVWKLYHGLFIAPRMGALYYFKSPQGNENKPVLIGDAYYNNERHKVWDTYFIPTLSVGYSF